VTYDDDEMEDDVFVDDIGNLEAQDHASNRC
jgi:hypothetical protein